MGARALPAGSDLTRAAAVAAAAVVLGFGVAWGLGGYGLIFAAAIVGLVLAATAAAAVFRRPELGLIAFAVVVTSYPVGRLVFGSAPLYFSDALLALVVVALATRGHLRAVPPAGLIAIFVLSWLPAWLWEMARTGLYLEPTYGLGRSLLAVSAVLVGMWVGRNIDVARRVVAALAIGTLVTGVIAVLQGTPATEQTVRSFLESWSPDFASRSYLRYPDRAFAFFQAPTTLSGFLAVMSALLLGSLYWVRGFARVAVVAALAVAGPALVATYSRQWVPALAAALFVLVVVVRPPRLGRVIVAVVAVGALAWGATAMGVLDAERLSSRFAGEGGADDNIRERIELQDRFFEVTREGGVDSIVGRGFAGSDVVSRSLVGGSAADRATEGISENSYLLEFFNHGVVAGVLLLVILLVVISRGLVTARRHGRDLPMSIGLVLALITAVVLMPQDRYFSEAIFMKSLLWFLIGWLAAVAHQRTGVGREPSTDS